MRGRERGRTRRAGRAAATVAALALAATATACGSASVNEEEQASTGGLEAGQTYKIGWAADKTEYLSYVDAPLEKGMKVALDEVNGAGGIAGKVKIELDIRDMKADPALGATVVQELIDSGANFVVTTCDTDVSLPGAQLAAQAKRPVMSSCGADASAPTKVPDGFSFLNVPGTLSQGAALAEFAYNDKGFRKAYVHLSRDEGYTQTLAEAFMTRFKELGGSVVGESRFNIGDTNYRVTATKMVNSDADVLMTNTFPPDSIALLKDLDRVGNKKPILLVDGNDTPVIFEGGPQLDLAYMTTYGGDRSEGSSFTKFADEYRDKFGSDPESLQSALGYDLIKVVAAAVEKADSMDGTKVRDALASLTDVEGATGPISYADSPLGQGLPVKQYALTTFDRANKEFKVSKTFFPEQVPEG